MSKPKLPESARLDTQVGEITGGCLCHEAFLRRGLKDPQCQHCDLYEEIKSLLNRIADLEKKNARYRKALAKFADLKNWKDPGWNSVRLTPWRIAQYALRRKE